MAKAWLDRQPRKFRERLLSMCRPRIYRQGSSLAHMGDEIEEFMGILEGCAEIHWEGFGEQSYHIQLFWPGDWFGEYALITGKPRKVAAIARTDVKAAVVPARALLSMLEKHPSGWRSIADLAAEHYELAINNLIDHLHPGKDSRCAAILLGLAHKGGTLRETSGGISIPISQTELAQLSNLSRNSIGTALKQLREQGLVDLQYGNIRICSVAALAKHLDQLIN